MFGSATGLDLDPDLVEIKNESRSRQYKSGNDHVEIKNKSRSRQMSAHAHTSRQTSALI